MSIKSFLQSCADWCENNKTTLVPALLIVYQIQDEQLQRQEAINQLKSVANCDTEMGERIFNAVAKYRGQDLTYRKWIIKQMPYPSTAHFEYLCFGRRVDRRSRWSQAGNKAHAEAFRLYKTIRNTRVTNNDISQLGDTIEARLVRGAICSFHGEHFEPAESAKWFDKNSSQTLPTPGGTEPTTTHRSRANAARHNIARFAHWLQNAESPRLKQEIRAAWDSSRLDFKLRVSDIVGELRIEQFLAETS